MAEKTTEELQLLYEIKASITQLLALLKQPQEALSKEAVQSIVVPLNQALNEVLDVTNDEPIASDLVNITRKTLSACLGIVKLKQQNIDTTDAQKDLQAVGTSFNVTCREFASWARGETVKSPGRATSPSSAPKQQQNFMNPPTQELKSINSQNKQSTVTSTVSTQPSKPVPRYIPEDPLKGCVINIESSQEYEQYIRDTKRKKVVNISINNSTCVMFLELYKEVSKANPHADFLYIDMNKVDIPSIEVKILPTFRFYKAGKMVQEFGGPFNHIENVFRDAVLRIISPGKPKEDLLPAEVHGLGVPGQVLHVDDEETFQKIINVPKSLVVVNFYDSMRICDNMRPAFEEVAKEHPKALFCDVNMETCKSKIRACQGIQRLPLFRFYKDKERLKEFQGDNKSYLISLSKQFDK